MWMYILLLSYQVGVGDKSTASWNTGANISWKNLIILGSKLSV